MIADLRYACRQLGRSPGFTLTAVLALGLGIGANSAIFSVVDAVLLRPLPYPESDRLVMVWEEATFVGFPRNTPAPANWVDWRKRNTVFTDVAASRGGLFSLTGDGQPEIVLGRRVTANFWTVLGVKPMLGRVFTEAEESANARVAVISYGLWQRRLGGDPTAVGRDIVVNDQKHTVIAVMPRGFAWPAREFDIWAPASFTARDLGNRGSHYLMCIARLKPGVSVQQAQSEMTVIARQLQQQYPQNKNVGAVVVPLRDQMAGPMKTGLLVLLGAAGCVLLIACANVANLLLSRASGRRREIAVRAALGAGRSRLVRQLVTESLLLASLGAIAGLLIARASMTILGKLVPTAFTAQASIDPRVLGFSLGLCLVTGVLFGLYPALSLSRMDLHDALKEGGRAGLGGRSQLMRKSLVIAEVALAQVLLVGAGLMIQTLIRLRAVDPGFRSDHLLTMSTPLPNPRYAEASRREAFFRTVVESVSKLPGVVSAGYTSSLPMTERGNTNGYTVEGRAPREGDPQDALFRVVTDQFLQTMGATLREGRFFSPHDRGDSLAVVIVNDFFAKRHWPGESPIGRRISMSNSDQPVWLTVAGVVRDVLERGLDIEMKPAVYMPVTQSAQYWPVPNALAVRTAVEPLSIAPAVRAIVASADKDQPIRAVRTMEQVVDTEVSTRQQQMTLLGAFAALALILASIGIYGVLSYSVMQRTREIGVRVALGANPAGVSRMVAGQGLVLTSIGLAIGIAAALAATRAISTQLYGIAATDPGTYAGVAALLTLVGILACYVPARRAARIDPVIALRDE